MSLNSLPHPIHVERNPLGDFVFYSDFVVAEWLKSEIDSFDILKMETVSETVYGDNDWGYVSNRTHSTVSSPGTVLQILQRKYAPRAVAIVTYSLRSRIAAQIEKDHCHAVPLEIFSQLEQATQWMTKQIRSIKTALEQVG